MNSSTIVRNALGMCSSPHQLTQPCSSALPQAVATFLRDHLEDLERGALGELLGHHEPFEVAVMHAFIDQQRFVGAPLDVSLRQLLAQFRLPGEAQKIDRIMEKGRSSVGLRWSAAWRR